MQEDIKQLSEKLDKLERITLVAAKSILTIDDVAMLTGYSVKHIYRLTSGREIPHFKRGGKLYFKKSEVEAWLTERPVLTNEQQFERYKRMRAKASARKA